MATNLPEITPAWAQDTLTLAMDSKQQVLTYHAAGFHRAQDVLDHPDCPKLNDPHPSNPDLKALEVRPDRKGIILWHVLVTYAVPEDGNRHPGKNSDDSGDPTRKPTEWDWDDGVEMEEFDRDIEGNPIVNSALDPFSTPAQATTQTLVIVAYRWYTSFDVERSQLYRNTVNEDDWRPSGTLFGGRSIPAGTAKCVSIRPTARLTSNARYVEVMHRFELRADGWKYRVMDQGRRMNAVSNNVGTVQPIVLVQPPKAPISQDVRLDGSGRPLERNTYEPLLGAVDPQNNRPGPRGAEIERFPTSGATSAVWLRYTMYRARRFAELNL